MRKQKGVKQELLARVFHRQLKAEHKTNKNKHTKTPTQQTQTREEPVNNSPKG